MIRNVLRLSAWARVAGPYSGVKCLHASRLAIPAVCVLAFHTAVPPAAARRQPFVRLRVYRGFAVNFVPSVISVA